MEQVEETIKGGDEMKFGTIHARDIIAALCLICCFWLISKGINGVVSGAAILIIGYYFSKRVYEENGNKTLSK